MAQEAASDFTIDFMFVVEYLIRRNEISNEWDNILLMWTQIIKGTLNKWLGRCTQFYHKMSTYLYLH